MRIAVYCSSREDLPTEWREAAGKVGEWIGSNQCELVYGGVALGLMRVVAEATRAAGGKVTGVVPIRKSEMYFQGNDVNILTAELSERKNTMQLLADVFVILPGGYGTLDEFASALAYINFGTLTHKRILLYNPDKLFDHLLKQLKEMMSRGLMSRNQLDSVSVADNIPELINTLNAFKK